MKKLLLYLMLVSCSTMAIGQTNDSPQHIKLTFNKKKTKVIASKAGQLVVNVHPKDAAKFNAKGFVLYSDFGAKGNGKTDDINSIAATHAFANHHKLFVKADEGASYYIGEHERTAIIQTDTDFGTASFMIDDTQVKNNKASIFKVTSELASYNITDLTSLRRNQETVAISVPSMSLVTVTDTLTKRYIRKGLNQNNGRPQTDIFLVDKNGNVAKGAPIIWDFDQIASASVLPLDTTVLTIKGGRFTTIANQEASSYNYYQRNIAIRRSNVVVDGLEHRITGEGEQGAPYGGFINIKDCAFVTIKNSMLTGHKTYQTIGAAGKPVSMGSYDITVNRALNTSFIDCKQLNDINDRRYWGIMASNFSKNLLYDGCTFSRFDAHMGVANATIRNSTLGHMGINAIGTGVLTLENATIRGRTLINLRSDYGSTWQGEFTIRNCVFAPSGDGEKVSLIGGYNDGTHNFGYTCYMPARITIENLHIEDAERGESYQGVAIFHDFNSKKTDDSFKEDFPYIITKEVMLKNVSTMSGKEVRLSDNAYMFKEVKIIYE